MATAAVLMVCASLWVIDGDTVSCNGQTLKDVGDGSLDISGYDAPETGKRANCAEEEIAGLRAAVRMSELIHAPGLKIEDLNMRDQFDRPVVRLMLPNGKTVGRQLIEEGHARVWEPEYRPNWCPKINTLSQESVN